MRLKAAAVTLFVVGIVGTGFGVSGFLDTRVHFCDPSTNPCSSRILRGEVKLPEGAKYIKYQAGETASKLIGSLVGLFSFTGAMVICRALAEEELRLLGFKQIADSDDLRRYAAKKQADFEVFYRKTNFDAAETAYTLMEPYQALLEGETLEAITDPGNKLEAAESEPIPEAPPVQVTETIQDDKSKQEWIKGFLSSTCLVWGNPGSGKSWFVRHLAMLRKQAGYRIIVFDPNSNRSEWMGVELYNTYEQIEEKIRWYVKELMGRYEEFGKTDISEKIWRERLWKKGEAVSLICEEMTTYTDLIADKDLLAKFVRVATTLSRKQEMPVTFIAHNNTQSCVGDIKGLGNLINRMQQIQLISTTDPKTAQPVASGKALIKLDGSDEWVEVMTPKLSSKIKDFRNEEERKGDVKKYLERTWNLEFDLDAPRQPKLSAEAQKVAAWLTRKRKEMEWISVEQCRASGCVQGARTADIKGHFDEIVRANMGVLNERGDIRLN